MHCRASLSDDFVIDNTKIGWRSSKYKIYKEQLLFDIERARFPETQPAAEMYQNAKILFEPLKAEYSIVGPQVTNIRKTINQTQRALDVLLRENGSKESIDELTAVLKISKRERTPLLKRLRELVESIALYRPIVESYGRRVHINAVSEKRVYVKACPSTGCSGFLNEEFYCGLCTVYVCKKCHEIKDGGNHECNEDTVASVKALKNEAKPCPSCATLISKIDGCDQMWCTQCKTTFSWRTGLRENGHTHNPHYYEWMRKNGGMPRAPGDVQMCGFPGYSEIYNAVLRRVFNKASEDGSEKVVSDETFAAGALSYYHRIIQHFGDMNSRPLPAIDNHELRVKLLLKELTEEKFKITVQRVDKAYRKSVAKRQIYDMTYQATGDIFRNMLGGVSIVDTYNSIDSLLRYSNTALKRIAVGYSCVIEYYPIIDKPHEPITYEEMLLKTRL